jgi:thiol-disulfide isomerase/thioredoxin
VAREEVLEKSMGSFRAGSSRRLVQLFLGTCLALAGSSVAGTAVAGDAFGGLSAPGSAHPWLGVLMEAAPAGGVLVKHVVRGSPADRGSVHDGDRITKIDGSAVNQPVDLSRLVAMRAAGDVASLVIARAGKESTVRVTLAARPEPDEMMRMDYVGTFAPAWQKVEAVGTAPKALSGLRGRVAVIDFWATWCGPCRMIAPKLSALQARYGAQGLTVVGITTDSAEKAALFAERVDMHYGVVVDSEGETSRAYGVSSLPTLFVVDRRGVVRSVEIGYDPSEDARLDQMIRTLLAEPGDGPATGAPGNTPPGPPGAMPPGSPGATPSAGDPPRR